MEVKRSLRGLNFKKFSIYSTIAILVILIIGTLILKSYFTSDRLERIIIPKIEESLGQEVKIESINLKFWNGFGLTINKFKVKGIHDSNMKYFAQFDTFNLDLALLPLLQRRVDVKDISLVGPTIKVERLESDEANYDDRDYSSKVGEKTTFGPTEVDFSLALDKLEIINGSIKYLDRNSDLKVELEGVNSRVNLTIEEKEDRLKTVGESKISKINIAGLEEDLNLEDSSFSLEHNLVVNLRSMAVDLKKFDLSLGDLSLESKGEVYFLEGENIDLTDSTIEDYLLKANFAIDKLVYQDSEEYKVVGEFDLIDSKVKVESLRVESGDSELLLKGVVDYGEFIKEDNIEYIGVNLKVKSDFDLGLIKRELDNSGDDFSDYGFGGRLSSDLRVAFYLGDIMDNLNEVNIEGDIFLTAKDIETIQFTKDIEKVEGRLEVNGEKVELLDGILNLGESDLSFNLSIDSWHNLMGLFSDEDNRLETKVEVDLSSNLLEINELLGLFIFDEDAQPLDLEDLLSNISLSSRAKVKEIRYGELKVKDLVMKGSLKDELVSLDDFKVNIDDGILEGRGILEIANNYKYEGDLKVESLEANEILTSLTDFKDKLYGTISLDLQLGGLGLEIDEVLESITIKGLVSVTDGYLRDWELVDKLSQWFTIFNDKELSFKGLEGRIRLEEGKLYLSDFVGESRNGEINLEGYSTLEGDIDYRLTYLVSEEESKRMDFKGKSLFYRPESERVGLDFNLKGSLMRPEIKWDNSVIQERAREEIEEKRDGRLEEEKAKVEEKKEEIKDDLKDRFRGIF